jgi:Domain of unknown function (DUF4167)
MKHNTNSRRGRNRNNGKRHVPLRSQTFESNGPDGKIRGTAQQVVDRYLALGRDAYSAGDPITAENFYQHAEHYYRLLSLEGPDGERGPGRPRPVEATLEPQPEGEPLQAAGGESAEEENVRLPF